MRNHVRAAVEEHFPNVPRDLKKDLKMDAIVVDSNTVLVSPGAPETVESEEDENQPTNYEYIMRDPLIFGDYRNACNEEEPRYYEDMLDYDAIYFLFQEIMEEYNERRGKLSLVLFEDALEHLTRIHRTLRMDRGNVMIVGVGGSGKQSLARLASYAAGKTQFM